MSETTNCAGLVRLRVSYTGRVLDLRFSLTIRTAHSNPSIIAALKEDISKCPTPLMHTRWVLATMTLQDTVVPIKASIDMLPPQGCDVFVFKLTRTTVRSLAEHLGLTYVAEECLKLFRLYARSDSLQLYEDGEGECCMSELVVNALGPTLEMVECWNIWLHPSFVPGQIAESSMN